MRDRPDDEAEHAVLATDEGRSLLVEVSPVVKPTPRDLARWRKFAPPEVVSAAIRLAEARRRGAAKFSRADRMWLDRIGLEQATAEAVATHKAGRFAGSDVFDLCSGIGGDAIAMAGAMARVIAVDRDRGMLRRLAWNAEAYGVRGRVLPVLGRAESIGLPRSGLLHIDPDRRPGGGRKANRIDKYVPNIDFLKFLLGRVRGGAIKLGPASDFEAIFGADPCEIEVTSLFGECKEATVWFGELRSCRRRATTLPSGETWTHSEGGRASEMPLQVRLLEPDPSLIRSGLLDGFALAHDLYRFAPGTDLFTSPNAVRSPFLTGFHVEDVLPLDMKLLRAVVARRGLGPLEIKTRGVDLRPEAVRTTLRPAGSNPATIFLIGGEGRGRAIVASREGRSA